MREMLVLQTGVYSHCLGSEGTSGIGWIFGHLIDGTQAEYVRVPYAENSVHKLPSAVSPEQARYSPTSCPPATRSASATGR